MHCGRIDGVAAGLAPGVVSAPPGERTISLRAPRFVDYATTLTIAGAGEQQVRHIGANDQQKQDAHR